MKIRIITAVAAIIILLPFLYFSATPAFTVFVMFVTLLATFELTRCTGTIKKWYVSLPSFFTSAMFIIVARAPFISQDRRLHFMFAFAAFYIFWMLCASLFSDGALDTRDAALTTMMILYNSFGFASLLMLRDIENGKYIYLLAFIIPWISDTFAYFTGKFFGRHKLIPSVSPKKTVEGAIGGIVFASLAMIVYGACVGMIFDVFPDYLLLAVGGALLAAVSQCGDLVASQIKRVYGVKDYGRILPGHGGAMDRFDSTVITASALYLLCNSIAFFKLFIN